mmetsp:Transcript_33319/g.107796  ORF Transcript_33319/g.107796 Transcript_33319/m.107796 type:complete len:265 (+) Transcript_33319:178-972(+)
MSWHRAARCCSAWPPAFRCTPSTSAMDRTRLRRPPACSVGRAGWPSAAPSAQTAPAWPGCCMRCCGRMAGRCPRWSSGRPPPSAATAHSPGWKTFARRPRAACWFCTTWVRSSTTRRPPAPSEQPSVPCRRAPRWLSSARRTRPAPCWTPRPPSAPPARPPSSCASSPPQTCAAASPPEPRPRWAPRWARRRPRRSSSVCRRRRGRRSSRKPCCRRPLAATLAGSVLAALSRAPRSSRATLARSVREDRDERSGQGSESSTCRT